MILLASLLSSLLSLLLTEGLLTSPLPRQYGLRSLDDVVYRKYKRGDDLSLMEPLDCDIFTCWVAVTSGDRVRIFSTLQLHHKETSRLFCQVHKVSVERHLYRCYILSLFERMRACYGSIESMNPN